MAKNLQDLVALLPNYKIKGRTDLPISAVAYDSRLTIPGTLFVCLTGAKVDGHDYIASARAAGAIAVVVEKAIEVDGDFTVIEVPDTRVAMQAIAPFFFDYPSRKVRMIGVTGTNGKTTTTHIIRSILIEAGYKVGLMGTIHTLIGDRQLPVKNTTPDVIDLQSTLADMVTAGMDYVVMEVSSHALSLNRIAGCEFDVAIFTNITQDHLDFHHTFDNYIDAKAELFRLLSSPDNTKSGKNAVINLDDHAAPAMLQATKTRAITYGIHERADLQATNIKIEANGAKLAITGSFGEMLLNLKITGEFNVYNVLAAVGAAQAEGIDGGIIKCALENFVSVPGRFELVNAGQPFSVIVDYAHTPDGLENILRTAAQFAEKRIIVVFGCGGDRDRTKRPIMGKIAAQYANIVIATSDNPRTEEPEAILHEIEIGIKEGLREGTEYTVVTDRRQAIARALHLAKPQDIVIIAGKGHETYQILKDRTIPFDDREIAREIIKELR